MKNTAFITFMGTPARGRCWICKTMGNHKWFDSEVNGLICKNCIDSAAFADVALANIRQQVGLLPCNPKAKTR